MDKITKLYQASQKRGLLTDGLTEEMFRQQLQEEGGADKFYNIATSRGVQLGDKDTYINAIKSAFNPTVPAQPTASAQAYEQKEERPSFLSRLGNVMLQSGDAMNSGDASAMKITEEAERIQKEEQQARAEREMAKTATIPMSHEDKMREDEIRLLESVPHHKDQARIDALKAQRPSYLQDAKSLGDIYRNYVEGWLANTPEGQQGKKQLDSDLENVVTNLQQQFRDSKTYKDIVGKYEPQFKHQDMLDEFQTSKEYSDIIAEVQAQYNATDGMTEEQANKLLNDKLQEAFVNKYGGTIKEQEAATYKKIEKELNDAWQKENGDILQQEYSSIYQNLVNQAVKGDKGYIKYRQEKFMEDAVKDAIQSGTDEIESLHNKYVGSALGNYRFDGSVPTATPDDGKAGNILAAEMIYRQALTRMKDTKKGEYKLGSATGDFVRNAINTLPNLASFGISDLMVSAKQAGVLKKIANANAYDNPESVLDESEMALYNAIAANTAAELVRSENTGWGASAAKLSADMLPFVRDIMVGQGLIGGLTEAGKKGIIRGIARTIGNGKWAKVLANVGVTGMGMAESAAIAGFTPSTYALAFDNTAKIDAQELSFDDSKIKIGKIDTQDYGKGLAEAYDTQIRELFTETGGNTQLMMRALKDMPFVKSLGRTKLGDFNTMFGNSTFGKFLNQAAYHGVIGELSEEWENTFYDACKAAIDGGGWDAFKNTYAEFTSPDTQVPMIISFSLPALLGGAGSMVQMRSLNKHYQDAYSDLKKTLEYCGVDESEVEDVVNDFRGSLYAGAIDDMPKAIASVASIYSDGNEENAKRLNAALSQYAVADAQLGAIQADQAREQSVVKEQYRQAIRTEQWQNQADEEATDMVEGITNKTNNYVYRVGVQGREDVAGYAVSGDIIVAVNPTDGSMKAIGNDVVTVKFDDGHVEQMQASELTILEAPVMAQDRIQAESARLFAKYANEETYQVGDKVYLTNNGQLMSGESSTITGIDDEGIHVEIEDANGQPNETIIPHEIAAEQLAKAPGETEEQIDEFTSPDGKTFRMRRKGDDKWVIIEPYDNEEEEYDAEDLANMGFTKKEQRTPITSVQPTQSANTNENENGQPANTPSYPVDQETGNPDWGQMDVEQSAAALVEVYQGDKQGAKGYADDMLKEAQKMQSKLAKQQSHSLNLQERIQEDNAIKAQRDAINAEVNKWQNIKLAIASIKTEAERQAEEEQRQKMMQAREERSRTEEGKKTNTSMAERYAAAPKIIGNEGTITLPDGRELKGRYVLTTPDAATASHDARNNFAMSSGYPVTEDGQSINDRDYTNDPEEQQKVIGIATNYNGNAIKNMPVVSDEGLVYNGNGRWMAGQLAAANGTDGAYTQSLMNNAGQFGFTAEQVQSIPNARVAFQLDERLPYNTSSLAIFNEQETQTQSNTGKAAAYARKLTPQAISDIVDAISGFSTRDAFFNDGKAPFELINRLIADDIISEREKAEMVDGDRLSALGRERLENIMLGTVFSNETIRLMGDDAGLKNSILRALPQILDNKSLGEFSLEQDINDAIRLLYEVRNSKMPFRAFVSQTVISEDGQVRTSAENYTPFQLLLAEEMTDGGVDAFRDVLTSYNGEAKQVQGGQVDIFGSLTSPEELKQLVLEKYGKETTNQGADAGSQTGTVAPSPQQGNGQRETDNVSRSLTSEQADELIQSMKEQAQLAPIVEYTPENYIAEFGEDGVVDTPICKVKMSDNQFIKLLAKNRTNDLGMIKPTLSNPDVIIEKYAPEDNAERDTKYLFIKTFIKADGTRILHYESVSVKKDNKEVSISNHEAEEKDIKKEMQNGNILHLRSGLPFVSELSLDEHPSSGGSDLVPTPNNLSDRKGTTNNSNTQIFGQENAENLQNDTINPENDTINDTINAVGDTQGDTKIQGVDYTVAEVEDMVDRMVRNVLDENGYEGVEIVGVKVIGSRTRNEAREDSDLDVLVEYKGDATEDGLFNLINGENKIVLDGVEVDVNPITRGKSGTIEQFMKRSDAYLAEQKAAKAKSESKSRLEQKVEETDAEIDSLASELRDLLGDDQNLYAIADPKRQAERDAKIMEVGAKLAVALTKKGVYKFADFCDKMIRLVGDAVRPRLKQFYMSAKYAPENMSNQAQFDKTSVVEDFDVDAITIEQEQQQQTKQENPILQSYRQIKEQYPDAAVLFRAGDFYEIYEEDADELSNILNITVTNRNGMRMAGFPFHALDTYLPKIVRAGKRVAIADGIESPKAQEVVMPNNYFKEGDKVTYKTKDGSLTQDATIEQVNSDGTYNLSFTNALGIPTQMIGIDGGQISKNTAENGAEILNNEEKSVSLQPVSTIGTITKSKDTRDGSNIWLVNTNSRVSVEEFKDLKKRAKDNNGYWSSFSKNKGFLFKTEEDANNFNNITEDERTTDETAANTRAIGDEGTACESEVETAISHADESGQAVTAEVTNPIITRIDETVEKANEQLMLLGYYEMDEGDFAETGVTKSATRKAVKDVTRVAKQLAKDLGVDDNVKATANIAPAGGDLTFRIPLQEGRELYVTIPVNPVYSQSQGAYGDLEIPRSENTFDVLQAILYRVENISGQWQERFGVNHFVETTTSYDNFLRLVKRECRDYLPKDNVVSPKENETLGEYAHRLAEDQKEKKQKQEQAKAERKKDKNAIQDNQLMGDLFADVMDDVQQAAQAQVQEQIDEHHEQVLAQMEEVEPNKTQNNEPSNTRVQTPNGRVRSENGQEVQSNEQTGVDRDNRESVRDDGTGSGTMAAVNGAEQLPVNRNQHNFHNSRGKSLAPTTPKARFDANIAAIRLMRELRDSNKRPTKAQQQVLAQYSGWGGLGTFFNRYGSAEYNTLHELFNEEELHDAELSINTAYYTPTYIIDNLWDIVGNLGFKGGDILEGSAGIGNILAQMPSSISGSSAIQAVELDQTTGGILQLLYPDAKVDIEGFQDVDIKPRSKDLVITNVPFDSQLKLFDEKNKDISDRFGLIHNFCIAKNVRALREGGIGVFITTSGTLDKQRNLFQWLSEHEDTDVIGAFRLNNATFDGAPVTSDIIVVRKRINKQRSPQAIDVSSVTTERFVDYDTNPHSYYDGRTEAQKKKDTKRIAITYNKYFADHPENMGGEMKANYEMGDTFRPEGIGLHPVDGKNQDKLLKKWVTSFEEQEQAERPAKVLSQSEEVKGEKVGALVVNSKGEICQVEVEDEKMVAKPIDTQNTKVAGRSKAEVLKDFHAVRDALNAVLDYQTANESDEGLKPLLAKLNAAYDSFHNKYGNFHNNTKLSWLRNDIDYSSVAETEIYRTIEDAQGKKTADVKKADVMSGRVLKTKAEVKVDNVRDAIIMSIRENGWVNTGYIAGLLGRSSEDVAREMYDSGLVFLDPVTNAPVVKYEYLSGNILDKLDIARANNDNGQFDDNIRELERVCPPTIPSHLITVSFGATWLDPSVFADYVADKTGIPAKHIRVMKVGSKWDIDFSGNWERESTNVSNGVHSSKLNVTIPVSKLLQAAINNQSVTVSRTEKINGETVTESDKEATQVCSTRIDQLKDEFQQWFRDKMQAEPERAAAIEDTYNRLFNQYVPMRVSKEFIPEHFDGATEGIKLNEWQAQAAVRATMQPIMLAHEVGSGKTFTMISAAMEMRRLGTAKKPMIVVQNATVKQFVSEAHRLYPRAKVLYMTDKDTGVDGRMAFYRKMKYNDWDMIIIPQSVFNTIPESIERKEQYIQEKIDEKRRVVELMKLEKLKAADNAYSEKHALDMKINGLEKEIEKMQEDFEAEREARLLMSLEYGQKTQKQKDKERKKTAEDRAKMIEKAKRQLSRKTDNIESFDDMDVDALFIDEAHEYKRLGFESMTGWGIKGIDKASSGRAVSLWCKMQTIFDRTGHKNVVFATGTPISNTAAEVWTFMKYLIPKEDMQKHHIYYFDDFVHNFGKIIQRPEFKPDGKFKEVTRFAQYNNVPELVRLWTSCSDTVLSPEKLREQQPDTEEGGKKATDKFLQQTRTLRSVMKWIRQQLEDFEQQSGKYKKEHSHVPMRMSNLAAAAAIDPRLIVDAKDEPNSKTNEAVKETLRALDDSKPYNGTVAIFSDLIHNKVTGFNLFEDIRQKLIDAGVPENQIAVISSQNKDQKQKIFDKVNAGEIRVILGSTQKLGVGVNIQERLFAEIHLDAPNRPMDYQQRVGRIIRQGNLHKEWGIPVRLIRFGVEDSLDVTAYQRLKTKTSFSDTVMKFANDMNLDSQVVDGQVNRSMEEDEDAGQFDNMIAQISGSQYAMLISNAERKLRKLEAEKKQFEDNQVWLDKATRDAKSRIGYLTDNMAKLQKRLDTLRKYFADGKVKSVKVAGKTISSDKVAEEIYKSLNERIEKVIKGQNTHGFDFRTDKGKEVASFDFELDGMKGTIGVQVRTELSGTDYITKRALTMTIPELGIDHEPTRKPSVKTSIEFIVESIVPGTSIERELKDEEYAIGKLQSDIESYEQKSKETFTKDDEIRKLEDSISELNDKMKEEMAAKEAKYAEMDAEVEAINIDAEKIDLSEDEDTDDAEMQISNEDYSEYSQLVNDAIDEALDNAGIEVVRVEESDIQKELDNSARLMLEIEQGTKALSSYPIAGAKLQKNLETTKQNYKKSDFSTRTAIKDIAKSINAINSGNSYYVTIEAQNGTIVTLRLSNHNATVSNFDVNNETNGISIVISRHDNSGLVNNGIAHVVEFFYSDKELNNTPGTPIADIIGALEQTMYSGEYTDPTGIAQRQEVNLDAVNEILPKDAEFSIRNMDAEYLQAVKDGDMEKARKMVLDAAKMAMPDTAFVDANGNPKVFYHNTPNTFTVFDEMFNGRNTDAGWLGDGFYFYGDPNEGVLYGKNKMSVFLNVIEPYFASYEEMDRLANINQREESIRFRERIEGEGHDGVYFDGNLVQEAVAFYPNQIKSAEPVTYDNDGNVIPLSKRFNMENDDIRYWRTPNGIVYGWAKDGKIYLTEDGLNPNTKIHEYTHLWAKAMQQRNREGWQSVVDNFKGTPMWDEVVNDPNYQNLQSDDAICSEALARFSGSRGAERMQEIADEMQHEAKQSGLLKNVAKTAALLQRVKKALSNFWKWVSQDLFGIKKFTSPEEVADRVLYDLVDATSLGQSTTVSGETDAEMMVITPLQEALATLEERIGTAKEEYQTTNSVILEANINYYRKERDKLNKVKNDITATEGMQEEQEVRELQAKLHLDHAVSVRLNRAIQAIRSRHEYDSSLVHEVAGLVNLLNRIGWLQDANKNEISTIIKTIANASSDSSYMLQQHIDNMMTTITDIAVRRMREDFAKRLELESKRAKKKNISKVESQGRVGIRGQMMLHTLSEVVNKKSMRSERLDDLIAEELQAAKEAESTNKAAIHYGKMDGYSLGKVFMEKVWELAKEEGDLQTELNNARMANGLSRGAKQDLLHTLNVSMMETRFKLMRSYPALIDLFLENVEKERAAAKKWARGVEEHKQEIRDMAKEELEGISGDIHKYHTPLAMARSLFQALASPTRTLESMLRMLGANYIGGEGRLYKYFMPKVIKASEQEYIGLQEALKKLDDKASDIMGKPTTWSELAKELNKKPGATVSFLDNEQGRAEEPVMRDYELTQGKLAYIYAVSKMEDGRMKLNAMGITEEEVQRIVDDVLDPTVKEVVDWLQDDFLKNSRGKYNEVHMRLFGTPMDEIKNYFPLRIARGSVEKEDKIDDDKVGNINMAGTSTGSIKVRTVNTKPLDLLNADVFRIAIEHSQEMEHWAAFSELTRDANVLFSDRDFQNKVKNIRSAVYGDEHRFYNNLRDVFRVAMGTYTPQGSDVSKTFLKVARGVTAAKISGRVWTAIKQLASHPAFFSYMADEGFTKAYVKNMVHPIDAFKWGQENLPLLKKRFNSRDLGDFVLAQGKSNNEFLRAIENFCTKYGMSANVFIDAMTCATGAKSVYDANYAKYIRLGMGEEEARRKAMDDAEICYNRSQQSTEGAFVSAIQRDRTWGTVAMCTYRNSNMAYTRNLVQAAYNIKNMKANKEKMLENAAKQYVEAGLMDYAAARKQAEDDYKRTMRKNIADVVINAYLMNMVWRLFGYLPYLIFGGDDDKKKDLIANALTGGMYLAPITGFIAGNILESIADGNGDFEDLFAPSMAISSDVKNIWYEVQGSRWAEAVNTTLNLLVQIGTGFNPETLEDTAVAICMNHENGVKSASNWQLWLGSFLAIPEGQRKQMFLDQLDELALGGEVDYSDLEQRYVDWKLIDSAPTTFYLRTDEEKEKAIAHYQRQFKKLYKERMKLKEEEDE